MKVEGMTQKEIFALKNKVSQFNEKLKQNGFSTKTTLDENDFMKLLVTQLKTQDPTKPMDDKEFISQMANFSALKEMTKLRESFEVLLKEAKMSKAFSLLNKKVSWQKDSGLKGTGIVEKVRVMPDGVVKLMVSGVDIELNEIIEVENS